MPAITIVQANCFVKSCKRKGACVRFAHQIPVCKHLFYLFFCVSAAHRLLREAPSGGRVHRQVRWAFSKL